MTDATARDAAAPDRVRTAVVLCAGWCRTCDAYRAVFDALRAAHPALRWHWLDVEDDAELVGEIDVQTFPTLILADGDRPWFAGPVLPNQDAAQRLLGRPRGSAREALADAPLYTALLKALADRPCTWTPVSA